MYKGKYFKEIPYFVIIFKGKVNFNIALLKPSIKTYFISISLVEADLFSVVLN